MSAPKRKGIEKEGDKKKKKTLFLSPELPSPASSSVSGPTSPASSSMSGPPSPASSSVSGPPSPASSSVSGPPSPTSSSVSGPPFPAKSSAPPSPADPIDRITCSFCHPPRTFKNAHTRELHEISVHSEEKGFYSMECLQDRSRTRSQFDRYLPALPDGYTTQNHPIDSPSPLGIFIKNGKGEIVGAFHIVVTYRGVSQVVAKNVNDQSKKLFEGHQGISQAHIIPGSSARDTLSMLHLSYADINFEPLNTRANCDLGCNIEKYTQTLKHQWYWDVCVFVLLDKRNILGYIGGGNGVVYPLSRNWSYLVFMEKGDQQRYQAFTFPNETPTKTYWNCVTDIAEIRRISGLDFQFGMTETIVKYQMRMKKESYIRDNPYACRHEGCSKRFTSEDKRKEHERYQERYRVQARKQ